MSIEALPQRTKDREFFWKDKILDNFVFRSSVPPNNPLNLSNSAFEIFASADHSDVIQPTVDLSNAPYGIVAIEWPREDVLLLPQFFELRVREFAALEQIDPDITWDDLPEDIWDEFEEVSFESSATWDRTIIIRRYIRNDRGRY